MFGALISNLRKDRSAYSKGRTPLILVMFFQRIQKLKQCTNLIIHDGNYTSFVVLVLVHRRGGGEGEFILNFRRQEGRLLEGGAYLRGGGGLLFEYLRYFHLT